MRITRGKVHKYIVTTLDFRTPVELRVTMTEYLKGLMETFPEIITGRNTIQPANHLFQVRPEEERMLLDEERTAEFHHMLAQLLFVTSRARWQITIVIPFLPGENITTPTVSKDKHLPRG